MAIPRIDIEEVIGRSEQGKTRPFICRGSDEHLYFIKGRDAGRRSQIAELICGQLAWAFGLQVAHFAVAEVPQALILPAIRADITALGAGPAFGSQALPHVQELNIAQLQSAMQADAIDPQTARDIFMFDWWIQNGDRTLTSLGGNPNLLWDCEAKQLVVIDHNCAFDADFNRHDAMRLHVFADAGRDVFVDLAERAHYLERFARALAAFDNACDNVPEEWWWVDDGVPADFDRNAIRTLLSRFNDATFWEEI
jgi:hypothetical protein